MNVDNEIMIIWEINEYYIVNASWFSYKETGQYKEAYHENLQNMKMKKH